MLQDFNTAEMTKIFTRGRQTPRNSNSFWQNPKITPHHSAPPCTLASVTPLENEPALALLCSWMVQSSGGPCADTVVLLLLLHLQPEFLLLDFEESVTIRPTLVISTRFFAVHGGFFRGFWKLFCDAAVLGDGENFLCVTEAVT